ncbi:MAG: fructosamine kinase family protein [Bacteroidales bacterium]|nr:fructosamine kinase family protein [Bacteroidales bacterium]
MNEQLIIDAFINQFKDKFHEQISVDQTFNISGGCINQCIGLKGSSGVFFLKWNFKNAFPNMFEAEMKGLELLENTQTLTIPTPLFVGYTGNYSFIAMNYITATNRRENFWGNFGEQLAALHKNTALQFGLNHDNYIGSLPQSNNQHDIWTDFFIVERLVKQVRLAVNEKKLENKHIAQFDRFYKKLPDIFCSEPPSLLHGDLWSENYIVDSRGFSCLIDPAVYYGHREMDLGMSKLFGGFSSEFYDSYNNAYPLEKGWQKRLEYCNLYPLLVHLNLFGKSYLNSIESVISRF